MDTKQDFKRESAKRIFADELKRTKFDMKIDEGDDKSPTFIITPTGAFANRILISGILTAKEKKTEKNILYVGTVNDNTGNFKITASHFNPEAQQQMARIKEIPVMVTVIGKPSMYKREDGKIFTTVRVEDIVVTDKLTRDLWILDTAKATNSRIAIMEKGTDDWAKDVKTKYNADMNVFKTMVKNAVDSIIE
jgi:RPA family protein